MDIEIEAILPRNSKTGSPTRFCPACPWLFKNGSGWADSSNWNGSI